MATDRIAFGGLLVALGALLAFAWGAGSREPWRTDEHRYIEVARAMSERDEWLVPTLNGTPYAHKPPAFFWSVAALHELGVPLDRAGLAPSVIASALSIALVAGLGRRFGGPRAAVAAAAVLASAELFVNLSVRANLDALLTLGTTGALFGYARWLDAEGARRRAAWAIVGGLVAGLGVLVKGPVALAIPAAGIAAHRALARPRAPAGGALALACAAACAPVLVYLAVTALAAGPDHVRALAIDHGVGHPLGQVDKQRPWYYYATAFPVGFLPWAALLPVAALAAAGRRRSGDLLALAWVGAPLVLLSLFPAKRHLYLLPLHPGAALLVGLFIARLGEPGLAAAPLERALARGGRLLVGCAALASGAAAAAGVLVGVVAPTALPVDLLADVSGHALVSPAVLLAAGLAGALLAGAGAALLAAREAAIQRAAYLTIAAGTVGLLCGVLQPLESRANDPSAFYRAVAARIGDEPLAAFGGLDFAPNWQLGRREVPILLSRSKADRFVERSGGHAWLVAEERKLGRLGTPARTRVALRGGNGLVLLQSEPAPPSAAVTRLRPAPGGDS